MPKKSLFIIKKVCLITKMTNKSLTRILIKVLCLFAASAPVCAQSTTSNAFQHPRDQIALQLGAIQMGYQVPFTLTGNISATKMQQAVNALVMGRNALNAAVGAPAVRVQGAVNSPNVDTVEYRDQLYSAVEYVVTSPVVATIMGSATLVNNKKVTVRATKITLPPNAWTIPVPFALEARSSADMPTLADELRELKDELGASGALNFAKMVLVWGGTLPQSSGLSGRSVEHFMIGKYEVTWGEWKTVRDWAVGNGYPDLAGIGEPPEGKKALNLPVVQVNWFTVLKWCNAKSEKEGLTPVYVNQTDGETYRTGVSVPTFNYWANGYRLPYEVEWEWAARGGIASQGYTYSGSNELSSVAWTYPVQERKGVGTKTANELGIYDMSGNVLEWCWDPSAETYETRITRGGSFMESENDFAVSYRDNFGLNQNSGRNWLGFRLARNAAF